MTKAQFLPIMAMIESAGKAPLSDEGTETYWSLLGDLPVDVMRIAAKRVLLTHDYPSFPSVSQIRQAASETMLGQIAEITPAQAWAVARYVAYKIDFEITGPYWRNGKEYKSIVAAFMDGVPSLVAKAIHQIGLRAIASDSPESVKRAQFIKAFEQATEQRRRLALMPPALVREIESRQASLPAPVAKVMSMIGNETKEFGP